VDVQFEPYYKRILNRDLSAIADYVDRNAARKDLDPSFYELIGRLVTIRFYAAADLILSDIEARGNIGYPTSREVNAYWNEMLLPLAENAKKWIREYLRGLSEKWNRRKAWIKYADATCKDGWEPQACNVERHRVIHHGDDTEAISRQRYMKLGLVPREVFLLLAGQRGDAMRPSWAVRKYLRQWDSSLKSRLKSVRQKKD